MVNAPLIFLFVPLVIEPLRVVLVASAYDAVIGRLAPAAPVTPEVTPSPGRPGALNAVQGSTTSRTNRGSASPVDSSSANGPVASSGTR